MGRVVHEADQPCTRAPPDALHTIHEMRALTRQQVHGHTISDTHRTTRLAPALARASGRIARLPRLATRSESTTPIGRPNSVSIAHSESLPCDFTESMESVGFHALRLTGS